MPDHVHMMVSIPPKHSVSNIVGLHKISLAILPRNPSYHKFWARGYFVSTVGVNEEVVRKYVQIGFAALRCQEARDQRIALVP